MVHTKKKKKKKERKKERKMQGPLFKMTQQAQGPSVMGVHGDSRVCALVKPILPEFSL